VQRAAGKDLEMVRLAIHPAVLKLFNLPSQRIKTSVSAPQDSSGTKATTVELDALPVDELRERVRNAVEGLIDFALWKRQVAVQEKELECI
jgi:hypothetical protein